MRKIFGPQGVLVVVVLAGALALASCGGGGDADDEAADDAAATTAEEDDADADAKDDDADSADDADGSSEAKAKADIPKLGDGSLQQGTAHVEVSGGKDLEFDAKGQAFTSDGNTLMTFATEDGHGLTIAFNADDASSGIAISSKDLIAGGDFGDDCSIDVDDGASSLKGTFECENVEGIDPSSVGKTVTVDVEGSFSFDK